MGRLQDYRSMDTYSLIMHTEELENNLEGVESDSAEWKRLWELWNLYCNELDERGISVFNLEMRLGQGRISSF